MKFLISPARMGANTMPTCTPGTGSIRGWESFQGGKYIDRQLSAFSAAELNAAWLSVSCCGPPVVLSIPKVYSSGVPCHRQPL
jgi:hypothetical protein